ncbi:MAG TPA: hypothetical protein VFV80_03755, partial [Geminicoccaceae bacterium]|nr:hypothetical protein [Geminicoccaceae bacterium]
MVAGSVLVQAVLSLRSISAAFRPPWQPSWSSSRRPAGDHRQRADAGDRPPAERGRAALQACSKSSS